MKTFTLSRLALLPILLLVAACGGEPPMDAEAPTSAGGLQRHTFTTGDAAKGTIEEVVGKATTGDRTWAASFGDGDRFWLFGMQFATPEAAVAALNRFASSSDGTPYTKAEAKNIAYQPGFQMRNTEDNYFVFFYTKGSWLVAVRAIAPDLEIAISSVKWVPAAS